MPAPVAPADDALWRPWAHLPLDLLRDISCCLHASTDYVRFHATCKPWRDTLPPAPCYPAFLPWLLAPPDSTKHRKARCVFSSSKSTRRGTGAAIEIRFPRQRWVISLVDGTAFTLSTSTASGSGGGGGRSVVHLTGSASSAPVTSLPPLSSCDDETKWWVDHADGVVSSDGTILVYLIGPVYRPFYETRMFNAALLRPGNVAWTMVRKEYFQLDNYYSCIAHHDGKIILPSCDYLSWFCTWMMTPVLHHGRWGTQWPYESGKALMKASYLLESRGELLLANVLAKDVVTNDCPQGYRDTIATFMDKLSVSVYALQEEEVGKRQWVKRDGRSFTDRAMFLGWPSSFAVDAARFGVISGGCAYFILKNRLYGAIWSKLAIKRCRVFKYSFLDNRTELIEQLPAEWDDDTCMWLTPPQPSIASTEEIRERVESSVLHTAAAAGGPQFGS